jgi:hypothetical protein
VNQVGVPYVSVGRMIALNIIFHLIKEKPPIELPNTPRAFIVLRVQLDRVVMCNFQSNLGVKNTPRYLIEFDHLMITSLLFCLICTCVGMWLNAGRLGCGGWKNITSVLSMSIWSLKRLNHVIRCDAISHAFKAVAM